MDHYKGYLRLTKFILVFIFMVILAGSIVRATQSGMGCPDWPTCFGNLIPPTEEYKVHFQPEHVYKKGQFIIYNDSLKYAKQAFTTTRNFNEADWLQYEKHNYAKFDLAQTWIEYINRLLTGLLGIFIVIHIIWSYRSFFKSKPRIFWLSVSFLVLTGFEAWLGKVVVDTNLAVIKVTAHMLLAILIAMVAVVIVVQLQQKEKVNNRLLKWLINISLLAVLVQIILGTEVREQVDEISKLLNYGQRQTWVSQLDQYFNLHKIMAWLAVLLCVVIFWLSLSYKELQQKGVSIFIAVLITLCMGLILAAFGMPAFAQPVHLLMASILFVLLFSLRLNME